MMEQRQRRRFIILMLLLLVIVGAAVFITKYQGQSKVGADVLGVIDNQAVATFSDEAGIEQTTLSNVSRLSVSGGVNKITLTYSLGRRSNQNAAFDIQFFATQSGQLVTTLRDQRGQSGIIKIQAKNIPDGVYDIAIKPAGFLSQAKRQVSYANGQPVTVDFPDAFKWGDIDVSRNGKGDNVINNADWSVLIGAWNGSDEKADYNADGVVNNAEAGILLRHWGPPGEQFDAAADAAEAEANRVPEL